MLCNKRLTRTLAACVILGTVLSLAPGSFAASPPGPAAVVVDDFESYTNNSPKRLYETWIDGIGYPGHAGNGSGAIVGHDILGRGTRYAAIVETVLVHGGKQSMPLYYYNNIKSPFYSEAERVYTTPQDWTVGGSNALSLWFRGQASNATDPLFVTLTDTAGKSTIVVHPDAEAARGEDWKQWPIALQVFSDAGVNLKSVKKLSLGVGTRTGGAKAGGAGILYVDDLTVGVATLAPDRPAGSIVAWGSNSVGQATPPAGDDFVAVAAGGYFSLALKADGSIVSWGSNAYKLGTPPAGKDFVAIAAGYWHALALKADGSIVGWGCNDSGEATPPAGTGFLAIAAGESYSLALRADHSIVGWGLNTRGQATAPSGSDFTAIAAGRVQSAALTANGTILVWGTTGWWYEGGHAIFYGRSPTSTNFIAVGVGSTHGLGLKSDGSVEAWGYIDSYPPTVKGLIAIAAGSDHDLALKADGSIIAWSRNNAGQASPPAGTGFIAIAGGLEHSLAIKKQ